MPSQVTNVPLIRVYDYLKAQTGPSGGNANPISNRTVTVRLAPDNVQASSAAPVTQLPSVPVQSTVADGNGYWEVWIVPIDNINPSGMTYIVDDGYRTYKINPKAAGIPGIGWQSSAIVVSTPQAITGVGGNLLPAGTTVLGNFTINGSVVVQGGNPRYDVSHAAYAGGAVGNGTTDDAPAIQAAGAAANAAGGGEVWLPPTPTNVYGIKSSLTIYANVTYHCNPGTIIRWIAGSQSVATYMLGCVAVLGAHLLHVGIFNITLDGASAAKVSGLRFDSVWWAQVENVQLTNCNGGAHGDATYALQMLDSIGTAFVNNTAGCCFVNLRIDSCRRGIQFFGNQSGTGTTNNFFYGLSMICSDAWCDFQQWCDSNYFEGYVFGAAFDSDGTFRGVTFGSSVSDLGVHSERFVAGSMDFNTSGMAAAVAIVYNISAGCRFDELFSGIGNVGGQVTFENGTLFTVNGAGSGRIEWINQAYGTLNNFIIIFDIGVGATLTRHMTAPSNVNGLGFVGGDTGNPPRIQATGTDANIAVGIQGKGTGGVSIDWGRFNFWQMNGSSTGNEMQIGVQAGDANVTIQINAKGNGVLRLLPNNTNWVDVHGANTGSWPSFAANGGDANIGVQLQGKGSGGVSLASQNVNYLNVFGGASLSTPFIVPAGGDANIDLGLLPKGTGFVNAGAAGARLRVDSFGHLVSDSTGTPASSNLGANVTSVTPTGNDVRGRLVIVMSGALAANTRIATITFANSYGATAPFTLLINQTSGAGLAIVNFYRLAFSTGVSFDLAADQALAAGTYECEYLIVG